MLSGARNSNREQSLYANVLRSIQNAAKLRLLLSRIKYKQEAKLALNTFELELLAECQRQYYAKPTVTRKVDSNGTIHITRSMDADPLLKAIADYPEVMGKKKGVVGGRLHSAIPVTFVDTWVRESKLRLGTREFAEYAKKRAANETPKLVVNYK